MMEDEVVIPFTQDEYGTTLELMVNFANRIISADDGKGPVDPMWPLMRKFFKGLHSVDLPERPYGMELLKWTGPA